MASPEVSEVSEVIVSIPRNEATQPQTTPLLIRFPFLFSRPSSWDIIRHNMMASHSTLGGISDRFGKTFHGCLVLKMQNRPGFIEDHQ